MRLALLSLVVFAVTGATLGGGPGCIAAITTSATGTVLSGQVVTFTDGSSISPLTRFVSRTWSFGDGSVEKSTNPNVLTVNHVYVNDSGREKDLTVRLIERTELSTCTTTTQLQVSAETL